MIVTEIFRGQGLGNQLWSIAVCQGIAHRVGTGFSILGREKFKGAAFLRPNFGESLQGKTHRGPSADLPPGVDHYFRERSEILISNGRDVTRYDERVQDVQSSTKVDGYFQSERYISHIRDSLARQYRSRFHSPLDDDVCVINFRGGEYRTLNDVLLPPSYYYGAMALMQSLKEDMHFLVVTDDKRAAQKYFGGLPIISHRMIPYIPRVSKTPTSTQIGKDFSMVQAAKYVILSNSSFSWWAAWTNSKASFVIAPKYWALHNTSDGFWSLGDSLTSGWHWLDRHGKLWTYEECLQEREMVNSRYDGEVLTVYP